MKAYITELNEKFEHKNLAESFAALQNESFQSMSFSTSFGQEDQVITDFILRNALPVNIFTLDTGRLFNATHQVQEATEKKYNTYIDTYFPESNAVEAYVAKNGINCFYQSVEQRKSCCTVRKIKPLQRALKDVDLWITGLRSGQSSNRQQLSLFQYYDAFGLIKFNPLIHWSLEEVVAYLENFEVPQNALHKEGFVSIGCEPCTRAIQPGEEIRAGRWWWENSKKECGLHLNTTAQ